MFQTVAGLPQVFPGAAGARRASALRNHIERTHVNKRILLLVEDSPTDEAISLRELRKLAAADQVVVARDGAEALDYLFATGKHQGRASDNLWAAVILDMDLPKVSGLEVLRQVRADARTRYVPIVIFTASDAEEALIESYQSGCNSFVRKPVTAEKFQAAVSQAGKYWLHLNEPPPPGKAE